MSTGLTKDETLLLRVMANEQTRAPKYAPDILILKEEDFPNPKTFSLEHAVAMVKNRALANGNALVGGGYVRPVMLKYSYTSTRYLIIIANSQKSVVTDKGMNEVFATGA